MKIFRLILCFTLFISMACQTGNLEVIADITNELKEVSAVETISGSNLFWVIEDAGNSNRIYGLDSTGTINKSIKISNAKNIDWEDLTADKAGNLYIGDFGDNGRNREEYTIYKVSAVNKLVETTDAEVLNFKLPKGSKSKDFEAFFIWKNAFYIFTKENAKFEVFKVENHSGNQTAELIDVFNLKGKGNHITSADISDNGNTIVLLNHTKLWELTGFKDENFFGGNIRSVPFNHSSQKEGVCFNGENIIITDENTGIGSNIYSLKSKI